MPLALRIFTFAMNVEVVSEGGSVDDALATFAICLTLASVGGLIVAAELHLHGIAKYFGFLAFRAGRGITLIAVGLVLSAYARPWINANESRLVAGAIFETVAGLFAAAIGLFNFGIAFVPPCCTCLALPQDKLAERFRAIHAAARQTRGEGKSGLPLAEGPDLEAGAKSEASSKFGKPKKSVEVVAPPSADNPFVNRSSTQAPPTLSNEVSNGVSNPFMAAQRT